VLSHLRLFPVSESKVSSRFLSSSTTTTSLPFSHPSLQGKVCLITGAGSGVGRAVALALAQQGSYLILAGRREDALQGTAKLISSVPETTPALVVPTDVSRPASVQSLFGAIKQKFGRLDILFNNAGMGTPGNILLEDLEFERWEQCLGVNLTGVFLCTREAFKLMKTQSPRGGRIINNGSISSDRPRPNSLPYTTTKHGITGLTKAASLDGRKYDIAVGQIDIGNAETEMTARMKKGVLQADGKMAVEPLMEASSVGEAVVYMASLPLHANVLFMTVMATKMPFVGRG